MYGSLSKYLNLSTNDMDSLKELLLQRQMALMDAGMSMMSGSGADPKQAAADAQALRADYDKKIQDLLGPQDYPVFQDYEKSAADRMSVQMFKSALPADATLTDQQEESLIAAMAEERKAMPATMSPLVVCVSLFFSAVTGLAAGIFPAWRAARMNPVDALRNE